MIAIANLILLNIHIKTKKLNAKKMIANIANPFNASAVYQLFIFSVFTVVLSLLLQYIQDWLYKYAARTLKAIKYSKIEAQIMMPEKYLHNIIYINLLNEFYL